MVVGRKRPALADITAASLAAPAPEPVQQRQKRARVRQLPGGVVTTGVRPPAMPLLQVNVDSLSSLSSLAVAVTPAAQPSNSTGGKAGFFNDGQASHDVRLTRAPSFCRCRSWGSGMEENGGDCLGCCEDLETQDVYRTPSPGAIPRAPPLGVVDIDNMEILSGLPESRVQGYTREYHTYLRGREVDEQPRHDYLDRVQRGVTRQMRTILVGWLYEVALEYDLMPSTLYMCISLVDRGLSRLPFHKDQLQCLGATCLFMACKFEEVTPPALGEFCYMTDHSVSKQEIIQTERQLVGSLRFILQTVTPYCFVHRFTRAAGSMQKEQALVHYLCELMLFEYWALEFKPSLRAAAALNLSRQLLMRPKSEIWSLGIRHYTGYEASQLEACVRKLAKLHATAYLLPQFEVVRKKFDTAEACHVAEVPAIREAELVFQNS